MIGNVCLRELPNGVVTIAVFCKFYKFADCHTAIIDVDVVLACKLFSSEGA